jgi:hypothetical protein
MGDDVLWEIRYRRTMASYDCPFPMLQEFPSLPAHVISRCLAFWFLVYSQSALPLSVFLSVWMRGVVEHTAIFRGDPSSIAFLSGLSKCMAITVIRIDKGTPNSTPSPPGLNWDRIGDATIRSHRLSEPWLMTCT